MKKENKEDDLDKELSKRYIEYLLEHKVFLMSVVYDEGHDAEFTFVSFDEDAIEDSEQQTLKKYFVKEDDIIPFVCHLYEIAQVKNCDETDDFKLDIDKVEQILLGKQIPVRLLTVPKGFYQDYATDILLAAKRQQLIRTQLVKILSKDKMSLVDADVFVDGGKNIVSFIFKDMDGVGVGDGQLTQINIVDEEEKASEFLYYLYKFVFIDQPKTAQLDDIVKELKGKWLPKNIIYADEKTKKLILRERLV